MSTISLAMIVKNEEDVLARCLDSVQSIVDEIIIVDTGSSDQTIAIAKRYSDKVFSYAWKDDFADARNYAFSLATMEYTMWLDADDVIPEKEAQKLLELKKSLSSETDLVMMKYHTGFDAQGHPNFTYYRERLMKTSQHYRWEGVIHEAITPRGNLLYSDIAIVHKKVKPTDPDRNLHVFEQLIHKGQLLSPREQYYYARELYYHQRYHDAIQQFTLFLNGHKGWVENCIDACRLKSECQKMIGRTEDALHSLFQSFLYDVPRAETLCAIGAIFVEQQQYHLAIYWYEQALKCKRNDESGAFIQPDCYDYIPYLQLCVCYDRLQEKELAFAYNERAAICKSDDPIVLKNRAYFRSLNTKDSHKNS